MNSFLTKQRIINSSSSNLSFLKDKSVNLVVTSPPYPMIDMWNDCFFAQGIKQTSFYDEAYMQMHALLNEVWEECDRVLSDNGFICINIGDAVKNCDGCFKLYPNHTKVIEFFENRGYCMLPSIIWNKPANSPNKFMGSGMLPAGAYVTLEHEYILIFRKGDKRNFKTAGEKLLRQKSAYFWEERNIWFSNIWNVRGSVQNISNAERKRSGAFPFEIPYRLINMYSVKGDTVFDPFLGTGTTLLAAIASQRNGIGVEISAEMSDLSQKNIQNSTKNINEYIEDRLLAHKTFIENLSEEKKAKCYKNNFHNFLVKTNQEKTLEIRKVDNINKISDKMFEVIYL